MATSGNYTADRSADYVIKRASKKAGGEPMSGTDLEDALDALNELLWEMSNPDHPLSRIKQKSVPVSSSVASYDLGPSVAAVYDAVIAWSQSSAGASTDYAMHKLNRYDYFNLPNKYTRGKPSQFYIEQTLNSVNAFLYPVPSQTDTFKFYAAIRPQRIVNFQQELDVHPRYIPAIIVGLAYKMSFDRRGIDPNYRVELKALFEQLFMEAREEDKERVSWIISHGYS